MMSHELPAVPMIRERVVDDVIVLAPERGLKGEVESLLKQRIDALVREGRLDILIDMKLLPRIDSSELGRLIRSHISARQAGGKVRLCNLSERVMVLMKMTRLDTVLDLYATEEDALESMRQQRSEQSTYRRGAPAAGRNLEKPSDFGPLDSLETGRSLTAPIKNGKS